MSDQVPEGWNQDCLNDISTNITKGTTPTTHGHPYTDSGVKFLRVENISLMGKIVENDLKYISNEANNALRRSRLQTGDLLISIAGAIGRSALVKEANLPANTNQAVAIVRLKPDTVDAEYIRYAIESPMVKRQMTDLQAGNAQVNLNLQQLGGLKFLNPPLPEQKKIAAILSSVDGVIEKTQAQINKLKDLKTGMMQELLTKGIGHTEFKDSPVGQIPTDWTLLTMRDVCTTKQGLQIPISERYRTPASNRYVYLTIKFINSGFDPKVAEYIEEPSSRVICTPDDIILARTGATGKVVTDVTGVFHNNFFMVDYDRQKVDKDYLVQFLRSPNIQSEISNRAGTTTIPDLNHGDFYSLYIAIPSLSEQKKISSILKSLDERSFKTQVKLSKLQISKKALMQDLLTGKVRVNIDSEEVNALSA